MISRSRPDTNQMKTHSLALLLAAFVAAPIGPVSKAAAFEGRITVMITQGSEPTPLLYTVGANSLRIEVTGSQWPHPIDIIDLKSGALTLLFPHNRSFVTFKR